MRDEVSAHLEDCETHGMTHRERPDLRLNDIVLIDCQAEGMQGSPILCNSPQRLSIPTQYSNRLQHVSDRNIMAVHDYTGDQEVMRPVGDRLQLETIIVFIIFEAIHVELSCKGYTRQGRHICARGLSLFTEQLIATTSTPSMQVIALAEALIACATFNVSTGPLASTNLDR